MELEEFIADNHGQGKYFRFTKSGTISISAELVRSLNLSVNQCLKFYNDKGHRSLWYFKIATTGYKVRKSGNKTLAIGSQPLRMRIMETMSIEAESFKLYAGQATRHEGALIYKLKTEQS